MNATDPLLWLDGAIEAEGLGVAAHYGGPVAEQRALEAGNAVVSLGHNGVVTVSGEDRLSWLNSMTSQHLTNLAPGESTESMLLDANGRIERLMRVVDDGETTWLLVDAGDAEGLTEFLTRMRFALRVEVANVSDDYAAVLAFDGGPALPALRALGTAVAEWRDPWAAVTAGGFQYSRGDHPSEGWSATQLVFRREDLAAVAELVRSGDLSAAGLLALEALEVRAWRPSRAGDIDDRSIPHEFDWMRTAVHLTKGCYRGQETVAKVHNLGRPPRRLTLLHLDGSGGELPKPGALVFVAGTRPTAAGPGADAGAAGETTGAAERPRPVGRITRAALHHEWGGVALALLKRSVAEDANLEVLLTDEAGGPAVAANQEVIVPADAGSVRGVPRLKRL